MTEKEIGKKGKKPTKSDRNAPKEQRFKERWADLNNNVRSSLCHWNELTQKYGGKISREEQQLQEIKSLLRELQKKLRVFND